MFKIEIDNYRSFKKQEFDFSKINILIGENSSGKSSLIKLLLALKQTLEAPTNRETNLAFTGEIVDLGNFSDNIYYHKKNLTMTFNFIFDKKYNKFFEQYFVVDIANKEKVKNEVEKIREYINGPISTPTNLSIGINKDLDKHESIKFSISNKNIGSIRINFTGEKNESEIFYGKICELIYFDNNINEEFVLKVNYNKDGFLTIITADSLQEQLEKALGITDFRKKDNEIPIELQAKFNIIFHKIAFLLITQNYLKYFLEKIEFINPLTTHPSRIYLNKDSRQNKEIQSIEDVVNFFSSNNRLSKIALEDFVKIMQEMEIIDDIEILQDDRLPVREIRVKIKDLLSNIVDVGYGVSLQLPILLKALLAERIRERHHSIILIEQPEVHLHPKLHAKLIEALIKLSINTTYIIETHSEHIVRKIQVLVKDKEFKLVPDDISINYFIRENLKSNISAHKVEKDGFLLPKFPSGFFDNSYLLSKELLD